MFLAERDLPTVPRIITKVMGPCAPLVRYCLFFCLLGFFLCSELLLCFELARLELARLLGIALSVLGRC